MERLPPNIDWMAPPRLPSTLRERTVMPRTTPRCLVTTKPGRSLVVVTIMVRPFGDQASGISPAPNRFHFGGKRARPPARRSGDADDRDPYRDRHLRPDRGPGRPVLGRADAALAAELQDRLGE